MEEGGWAGGGGYEKSYYDFHRFVEACFASTLPLWIIMIFITHQTLL